MIELTTLEAVLLLSNIVSWWVYFKTDERRRAAEFFAKAMIEDKEMRDMVLEDFEKFKGKHGI